MSKSILSYKKECFVCHAVYGLHKHHIYYGAGRRKISEKEGCWVYLCAPHHNGYDAGVHFDHTFDRWLKQVCQEKWESCRGSREDFRKLFGRSYL